MSLLMRLTRSPYSLFLAGDTKQIVNPSGFRWEELKELFYERRIPVLKIHHLTLNFRCVGNIALLSNCLLELKRSILGIYHDEALDEWKMLGQPPFIIFGLDERAMLKHLSKQAANQIMLTRSEQECTMLKELLGTELIFAIRKAKGLEFKSVLLWKFFSTPGEWKIWRKILEMESAELHDALVRHGINLLYVGVTRAQQNLLIYDGINYAPIWDADLFKEYVVKTADIELFQRTWFNVVSLAEWKE